MARQDIYLGVEGNDGTGDSIRESFRKVNENFRELYAVFGQGGTITFKALSDTPDEFVSNNLLVVDSTGTRVVNKDLVAGEGITIDNTQEDVITITNVGARISADTSPILGGPLSGNQVYPIGNIATDETAVSDFNTTHGTQITQDDLVIDKKFADQHYGANGLFENRSGYVRSEPLNADEYSKTIEEYRDGNIVITGHGLDSSSNGLPWLYTATSNVPTNLVDGTTYYARFVNENQLSLHTTKEQAQNNNENDRVKVNINLGDQADTDGIDIIQDQSYDENLYGYFRSNEALPRESVVRRQGDDMEGALFLHDHPGDLAGVNTGIPDDLQAATKYYVDNTSFASTVDLYVSTAGDDSQATTPVGKEGRALNYAYRSLNKAAQKAEELIESSPLEPGAYTQTVTYDNNDNASVIVDNRVTSAYADAETAQILLRANRKFIQKETVAYVKSTYPNLSFADTTVANPNAEAILFANKAFIQEEVIAWIDAQIANGQGIWTFFTYDSAKCKRDTGYIVDAWINDIAKGGNIETRRMAYSYWAGNTNRVAGQEAQTVAALEFARDLVINNILTGTEVGVYYNVDETQVILDGVTAENVSARVTELTSVLTDVINGQISDLASPVEPPVADNTCERDIGLIVDGLIIDIGNGVNSNFHAIQSGVRYFSTSSGARARISQGTETIGAINHAKAIINQIVTNQTVTPFQTLISQFKDVTLPSVTQTVRNALSAKLDITTTVIQNGLSARPKTVEGSTYRIDITNGGFDSVDQGVNTNVDILPGKVIRGKTSGALGRIVKYSSGLDLGGQNYDRIEVVLQEPREFVLGEELEYGNFTRTTQITIHVETGVYYEDYPIKVPANVSVKGSDFRRCIIRPADRVSQSPWANTYFYRDKLIDNIQITDMIGNDLATNTTLSLAGNNTAGETVICTPGDGIAPLSWEGAFIYTDSGALGLITNVSGTDFDVLVSKDRFESLQTPLNAGEWHIKQTVNYGHHYLSDPTDIDSTPKNNKLLDVFLMNDATRLANMTFQGHGGFAQVLDPAGQILIKSPYVQVCGSFSASINEQAFRGGMYIDAFSGNLEMQIDSKDDNFTLNVSSAVGKGLRLRKPETPCPFFIGGTRYQVDAVTEYDGEAGTAKLLLNKLSNNGTGYAGTTFPQDIFCQTAGNRSILANDYTQVNDLGYGLFCNNGSLSEQVSTFTYYCHTAFFANNGSEIRSVNGSNANGNFGLVAAGSDPNEEIDTVTLLRNMQQPVRVYDDGATYDHPAAATSVYITDCDYAPYNNSLLDVVTTDGVVTYEVTNASVVSGVTFNGTKGNNLPVYRLTIGGDGGLEDELNDGNILILRMNKNYLFGGVTPATTIRPSTALIFNEQPSQVYRTISFSNQDSDNSSLPVDRSQIVFDSGFDFLNLLVDPTYMQRNDFAGSGTTMGATVGDRVVAIRPILSQIDIDRINNDDMIFTDAGKTFIVRNYEERVDAGNGNYSYATISLLDLGGSDINTPASAAGLAYPLTLANNGQRTIPLSLQDNEDAGITVKISTLRANGHDFDNIGTGGFNTTNYPSVIYGEPVLPPTQANEVVERGKGRVFWVSTDQDGFFRVGRFFSVDQGTGTVTFAASIAISNLDGLGFRRGVRISEFSNDDTMSDRDPQSVPTEFAVDSFVDRRLHFLRDGTEVSEELQIGPGVMPRDGSVAATDDMNLGGNQIVNIADPRSGQGQDAATKSYVDARTPFGEELRAVNGTRTAGDLIIFNGSEYENATPIGDLAFVYNPVDKTVDIQINNLTIANADVAANAQISQSKLNLNSATTRVNADSITQNDLGSASFNDSQFSATSGWVSLKDGGVNVGALEEIDQYQLYGRTASGTGNANIISFADVVENGGTFTTQGEVDAIVKTRSDGGIDGQSLYIDSFKILDQSANTLNFTTPGGGKIFDSVGTIPSNITTTFEGSILIQNPDNTVSNGVTASTFQKNSTFGSNTDSTLNSSRLGVNWIYSSFIEAPGERDASSTGISIGAGTGFTSGEVGQTGDGQVCIIANSNNASIIFKQTEMIPYTDGTYNLGNSDHRFGTFYGTATAATYADLAERYLGDNTYEPGTVIIFGGTNEVTLSNTKDDRRVAGVVTTNPAHLMNSALFGDFVVDIALQGRVPCKVIGKVEKGDLLVTSSIPGYAMVNNDPKIGTVIGKAVGVKDDVDKGVVEVVVGRV